MKLKDYGLGMSQGKASHILMKDILWKLIVQTDNFICHHCHEPMSRETFSIEHKVPWRFSENPTDLFFDLDNISFSHLKCNVAAARNPISSPVRAPRVPKHGTVNEYKYGKCRCELCRKAKWEEGQKRKASYDPEKRRRKYLEKGN